MKTRIQTLLLIGSLLSFSGCGPTPDLQVNELNLGVSADYPPFAYQEDGRIVGLEIDLAEAIAEEAGFSLVINDMDFSGIIPALKYGRIDFAMASLSVTNERKKNVDFTIPYYEMTIAAVTPWKDRDFDFDFEDSVVGVQQGSTLEVFANEQEKEHNMKVVALPKTLMLIEELKLGRIDAILMDTTQARAFVEANADLHMTELPEYRTLWAAAVGKDACLLPDINDAIKKLKKNGELDAIKAKWLKKYE